MKTFQHPLSAQEEAHYLSLLQKHDSTPEVLRAKEVLMEHNLRLVAHVVKKYQQSMEEDTEDLLSVGCIGLWKAIDSYDCTKGKLATYACKCIDNELLMLLRGRKKISKDISIYESIGKDKEGNDFCLVDVLEGDNPDIVEQVYTKEVLKGIYYFIEHRLTKRERLIMKCRYGILGERECTQMELARRLHISRSYVSRIEKKVIEKLQREFYYKE